MSFFSQVNSGKINQLNASLATSTQDIFGRGMNVLNPPAPLVGLKGKGTDDTQALQNLIAGITQRTRLIFPYDNYHFSNTISLDPSLISIVGFGTIFTFSNAGIAFLLKGGSANMNFNALTVIEGIELVGAGRTVTGSVGIQFSDSISNYAPFTTVRNCVIHEFYTGVTWNSNTWLNRFDKVSIYHTTYCVDYPSGLANSGEEIVFNHCVLFNSTYGIRAKAVEIVFTDGSIDYIDNRFVECDLGGAVTLQNVHIEGNSDNDYWLYCTDSQSIIYMSKGSINNTLANKSNYQFGYTNIANNADGGIHLDGVRFGGNTSASYAFPTLIKGQGTSRNLLPYVASGNKMVQSLDSLNYLVAGGFETGTLSEWTLSAGTNGTIDATQSHSGTNSLKLACTSGQYTSVYHSVPVVPGSKPRMSFYAKTAFGSSVDQFFVKAIYYDNTGAIINAPTYTLTFSASGTHPSNWTLYFINPYQQAPAGATTCRFYIQQCNSTTTSDGLGAIMNIDDIIITVE